MFVFSFDFFVCFSYFPLFVSFFLPPVVFQSYPCFSLAFSPPFLLPCVLYVFVYFSFVLSLFLFSFLPFVLNHVRMYMHIPNNIFDTVLCLPCTSLILNHFLQTTSTKFWASVGNNSFSDVFYERVCRYARICSTWYLQGEQVPRLSF